MLNYAKYKHVFDARLALFVIIGLLLVLASGQSKSFQFTERPNCQGEDAKELVVQIARHDGLIRPARVRHTTSFNPNQENDIWYHIDRIRTRQNLSSTGAKLCSARLTVSHIGDPRITRNLVYAVGQDDHGQLAIALM